MDLTLPGLLRMARDTVSNPRDGARRIMAIDAPVRDRWAALVLMAVVSALLTHLSYMLSPPVARDFFSEAMSSPLRTAVLQGVVMLAGVHVIHRLGRARGGTGELPETINLMVWLQFILLIVQVAQLVAQVLVPPLAQILGLAGLGLFFWLLTHFICELHGFRSMLMTFLGIIAALFALGMIVSIALTVVLGVPQA